MASISKKTLEEDKKCFQVEFERVQERRQKAEDEMVRIDGALVYIDHLLRSIELEKQSENKGKEKPNE